MTMDDIVPGLLESIQHQFDERTKKSAKLKNAAIALKKKEATYLDANSFAIELGEILASIYAQNLTKKILPDGKMFYNIAERIIQPTMKNNYNLVSGYAGDVQTQLNHEAGLYLKTQVPDINQDRIKGIINRISSEPDFNKIKWMLDEPIVNFSQSIVDDSIKKNAGFQSKSGLHPKIIRRVSGHACKWCRSLAGSYDYETAPDDIYRRHERCQCTVDYDPGDGRRKNVWSKRWQDEKKRARIKLSKELEALDLSKASNRDIANMIDARLGKPMTVENADRSNANPNYYKGSEYQVNCQRCVPTYEMRRRGLEVEAMSAADRSIWDDPFSEIVYYDNGRRGLKTVRAFVDPVTKEPVSPTVLGGRTMKQNYAKLEKIVKDGERYTLSMAWQKNGAHIVNMERINGVLSIVDAQSGSIAPIDEYFAIRKAQPKSLNYCRIDNLEINPSIVKKIAIPKKV